MIVANHYHLEKAYLISAVSILLESHHLSGLREVLGRQPAEVRYAKDDRAFCRRSKPGNQPKRVRLKGCSTVKFMVKFLLGWRP